VREHGQNLAKSLEAQKQNIQRHVNNMAAATVTQARAEHDDVIASKNVELKHLKELVDTLKVNLVKGRSDKEVAMKAMRQQLRVSGATCCVRYLELFESL
jgi:hypothetical protein